MLHMARKVINELNKHSLDGMFYAGKAMIHCVLSKEADGYGESAVTQRITCCG